MEDDDPQRLTFDRLYISSSDTLNGKLIDQTIEGGWNDRPPLFVTRGDDVTLLKGMLRQGVPPILRCALWVSSVVKSCHTHRPPEYADSYRTLGKVRQLDYAWDAAKKQVFQDESDKNENLRPSFGNVDHLKYHGPTREKGKLALTQVLCALEHILGLEYVPLMPPIATIFLGFMAESYTFCALRVMAQNSSFYFPINQIEHHAWCKAFGDVLGRLHPQTAATMKANGALSTTGLDPIFRHFFLPILPYEHIQRIMDIYTYEGYKVLFRFGIALLCLFRKDKKELESVSTDKWWKEVRAYTFSRSFNFGVLVKKAYGYHGHAVRKRLRFPRRQIIARIIRLEEERAVHEIDFDGLAPHQEEARPLGFVEDPNLKLVRQAEFRASLASWLPLSLRLTKLRLIYSTDVHGRTLDIFYRHVKNSYQTILLCQVLDNDAIIGMFAPQTWRVSPKIYGNGECFVFRLDPDARCWKWKPDESLLDDLEDEDSAGAGNIALGEQFMVGRQTFISMGGSEDGTCGLRLNEDLTKGESTSAKGFNNDPLPGLTFFEVGLVEVYQLVSAVDGRTTE